MSAQRTVRVRIAVVVTTDGQWGAAGWPLKDPKDKDWTLMQSMASDALEPKEDPAHYWIEADVPIPTVPVIIGEVEL